MAKKQTPTVKSDTTKIPTPYKVPLSKPLPKQQQRLEVLRNTGNSKLGDSTKAKTMYNSNVVQKALGKRNTERINEGKKPIPRTAVFGSNRGDESTKGKTFKEAPLVIKKVAIKKK